MFINKIIFFIASVLIVGDLYGTVYYVSPKGNNSSKGTSPERPWQSVQYAVDKMKAGDVCQLMEGVYRESIKFKQSGRENAPIQLLPYQNQRVVITGLDKLGGWKKVEGEKYWQASISWDLGRGKNQLFYDNEVMLEARYPNMPDSGLQIPAKNLSKLWPTFGDFSIKNGKKQPYVIYNKNLTDPNIDSWEGAMYYGVHNEGWCAQTAIVEHSENEKISVKNPTSRWWFTSLQPEEGRGMLIGHRKAFDTAGEWLMENQKIMFITEGGQNPEGKIEVKKRQIAFDFSDASFIKVKGIQVKAASVCMRNSSNCTMEDCDLSYITHFTIFDDGRNGNIDKLGDRSPLTNGFVSIYVSGHHNSFLNCKVQYSAGGGIYLDGYNHTIHNTLINECSYTCTYLASIMVGSEKDFYAGGHIITNNTISNSGRALLHFDGTMNDRDEHGLKYAASLIANNHFFNGVLQGKDGGAINSWNSDLGAYNNTSTQFYNNVLHDCFDPWGNRWNLGIIYMDNNTRNFHARNNLVWASIGSVQKDFFRNPHSENVSWDNNIFYKNMQLDISKLDASIYPDGKPFSFGYNPDKNPPIPKWGEVESSMIGLRPFDQSNKQIPLKDIKNGSIFIAQSIDFDQNWQSVSIEYSSGNNENVENNASTSFSGTRHQTATDPLILSTTQLDSKSPDVKKRWSIIYNMTNNSWMMFPKVVFGDGYKKLSLLYASRNSYPKWVEFRADKPDGELLARIDLPYNQSFIESAYPGMNMLNPFVETSVDFPESVKGTKDVYIVTKGGDGYEIAQFAHFRFDDCKGEIPLKSGDRKIEMRLDSPKGERLGYIYTQFTGGKDKFRKNVINIKSGISGKHDVFFVVRSTMGNTIIDEIKSIAFEKADLSINLRSIKL